jgi:hypothetical protein
MKRSKFSEEQLAYALRQAEAGRPVGGSRSRLLLSMWFRRQLPLQLELLTACDRLTRETPVPRPVTAHCESPDTYNAVRH